MALFLPLAAAVTFYSSFPEKKKKVVAALQKYLWAGGGMPPSLLPFPHSFVFAAASLGKRIEG